jgi:hypothetical protein
MILKFRDRLISFSLRSRFVVPSAEAAAAAAAAARIAVSNTDCNPACVREEASRYLIPNSFAIFSPFALVKGFRPLWASLSITSSS